MSGYLIGFITILFVVFGIVVKIMASKIKSQSKEIKSKDDTISTQQKSIESYKKKEQIEATGKKAREDHKDRVSEIKKDSVDIKKKIEEGMTDEEMEALMADLDDDNNSKL